MSRNLVACIACFMLLFASLEAVTEERAIIQPAEAQAAWREDLAYMVERMESIHPNLFWRISEADFRQQVANLDADIPYLTDNQIIMQFAALAAHGGGHSYVWWFQDATEFRTYPLWLYWFSDGLYVIDAQDADLIGARVVQIGSTPVDDAFEQITPMISNDNDMGYLLWSPLYYAMPELLQGLGIIDDLNAPEYLLELPDGEQMTYNPRPMSFGAYMGFTDGVHVGLPQQAEPLYRSRPYENFWLAYLEDSQTLYIQYNAVSRSTQSGINISRFSEEIAALVEEQDVQRVVVDLRQNGGGDNTTYYPFLSVLRDNEAINQPGKLFVITGRYTFSAAMNFASDLEQQTEALFVGEPTGSRPNHYGDSRAFTLPNSGLTVNVAPQYLQDSTADDTRDWIEPDIPAALSSADYFAGRDPALNAILSYEG